MLEIKIHVNLNCPDLVQVAAALTKCFGHKAPAPVEQPAAATAVKAAAAPAPAQMPATPVMPATPTPAPAPGAFAPAAPPKVPLAGAPEYTLDQLALAGGSLMNLGPEKAQAAQALIPKFGITSLTELPRERYGEFATALRGLGANI